jgi:hypothetical protein
MRIPAPVGEYRIHRLLAAAVLLLLVASGPVPRASAPAETVGRCETGPGSGRCCGCPPQTVSSGACCCAGTTGRVEFVKTGTHAPPCDCSLGASGAPYSAFSDNRFSRKISLAPQENGTDPSGSGRSLRPGGHADIPAGHFTEPPDPPPEIAAIV